MRLNAILPGMGIEERLRRLDKEIYEKKDEYEKILMDAEMVDYLIEKNERFLLTYPLEYREMQVDIKGESKFWYINELKEQQKDIEYLKRIIKILRDTVNEYSNIGEEL